MTQSVIRKLFQADLAENLDALREEFAVDKFKSEVMIVTPRRWGKCLGPDELILTSSGRTIRAADVRPGDQLVGDDGRARLVMNTTKGMAPMFRVSEAGTKGSRDMTFTCNDAHLLVFQLRGVRARMHDAPTEGTVTVFEHYCESEPPFVRARSTHFSTKDKADAVRLVQQLNALPRETVTIRAATLFKHLHTGCAPSIGDRYILDPKLMSITATVETFPDGPAKRVDADEAYKMGISMAADIPLGVDVHGLPRSTRLHVLAGLFDYRASLRTERYRLEYWTRAEAKAVCRLIRSVGLGARLCQQVQMHNGAWTVYVYGDLSIVPCRCELTRVSSATHQSKHTPTDAYITSIEFIGTSDYYGFQCASFAQDATTSDRHRAANALQQSNSAFEVDLAGARLAASGVILPSLANGERAADGSYPGRFLLANHTVVHNTYSVAMFVAACASSIERTEQAIFSTGRRASEKLLQLIFTFLCKMPGMRESIIKKTVETIWIQGPLGPDDIRKISSYPSKVSARAAAGIG